jgi:transcriptional regulator with XRE-family HTH domain
MSYLNEKIKGARKAKRLTQKEVAEILQVSERMYQRYEKDIEPSVEQIKKLDSVLGSDLLNQIPFDSNDDFNFERAMLKALSYAYAGLAAELAALKGEKPLSTAQYLDKIDESTNLILTGLRMSGEKKG